MNPPLLLFPLALLFWIALPAMADLAAMDAALERGAYRHAAALGDAALEADPAHAEARLKRAQALAALGFADRAVRDLEAVLRAAESGGLARPQAQARVTLGRVLAAVGRTAEALPYLEQGRADAERLGLARLAAAATVEIGQAVMQGDRPEAARGHFEQGLGRAAELDDPALSAAAMLGLAQCAGEPAWLRRALDQALQAGPALARAELLLRIGRQAQHAAKPLLAFEALSGAARPAQALGQARLAAEALGRFGALYEAEGRNDEALRLTDEAVMQAQFERASDLLLRWEWQRGRLLRALGRRAEALGSYQRAVAHIEEIRADIPIEYQDGRSSFRVTLSPVYLGLVDLLLETAAAQQGEPRQATLRQVLGAMEKLKTAELQDYYKDACAVTASDLTELMEIAPGVAILYPIVFPQRLELLVQAGGRIHHRRLPVSEAELDALSIRLARGLRPTESGVLRRFPERFARRLHEILIEPVAALLQQHQVHTLVYVPDGVLRKIPLATLWDGERFLAERYAVATAPGLTLLEPKPLPRSGIQALLAGLSKPGGVVDQLPERFYAALAVEQIEREGGQPEPRLAMRALGREPSAELPEMGPDRLRQVRGMVQQALHLPGVEEELRQVGEVLSSRTLMDDQFALDSFEQEMQRSYRIVHIASHGIFSGDPEQSFILTHDRLLNMSRLEALLKSEQFSDAPVELLTLSACQTAEGDDRSPLGLSGVALKSGARSALGSLWPVSDNAARILLPDFYRHLKQTDQTKAQALQQAQIALLNRPEYRHPGYWAAFILIGNWL